MDDVPTQWSAPVRGGEQNGSCPHVKTFFTIPAIAKTRPKTGHPEPGQAEPGQAEPGQAEPGQAEPGQA